MVYKLVENTKFCLKPNAKLELMSYYLLPGLESERGGSVQTV
jgi:hypothetical protein